MKPGAIDHSKTLRLAKALRRREAPRSFQAQAAGHLAALYAWAWGRTDDGDLSLFEPEDIAAAAKWRGDPEAFVDLLVELRLLDRHGDTLTLHDADEHRPEYVRKRLAARERRGQKDGGGGKGGDSHRLRSGTRSGTRSDPRSGPSRGASASASATVDATDPSPSRDPKPRTRAESGGRRGSAAKPDDDPPQPAPDPEATPLADAVHAAVAEAQRRMDAERGGPPVRGPTKPQREQAAAVVRRVGAERWLQAVEAYVRDEHPSTASLTLAEMLRRADHWLGVSRRTKRETYRELRLRSVMGESPGGGA